MRIARFSDGTNPVYGALEEGSKRIVGLKGDPLFSPVEPSGQIYELDEVRLLSPVIPRSKVVGIGNNYSDTPIPADERPEPPMFLKANTSVIGPDDPIAIPSWSNDVAFEGELAIVIKSLAKDVSVQDAPQVILGYTVANDVTARDDGRTLGARQVLRHLLPAGSVDHGRPHPRRHEPGDPLLPEWGEGAGQLDRTHDLEPLRAGVLRVPPDDAAARRRHCHGCPRGLRARGCG